VSCRQIKHPTVLAERTPKSYLNHNQFVGTVPTELLIWNLENMALWGNNFVGTLPAFNAVPYGW